MEGSLVKAFVIPALPHPLLASNQNPGWARLRTAIESCAQEIAASGAEMIMIYSTRWISVIGHQIQARPNPEWTHVDEEWHELGEIPYKFLIDSEFAHIYQKAATQRGLHARTVDYHGFPIDTGSISCLKLLNPANRIPACIVSCNMYADRSETIVLGKAMRDAVKASGRKVAAIAVTALSNRMFTQPIGPEEDRISSRKDDEWNRKVLELFSQGRLEDVSQLARQLAKEANIDQKFKAIWWLSAAMAQGNRFNGKVLAYEPIYGTGAAVVSLTPSLSAFGDQEYDEDDIEVHVGERNVLEKHHSDAPIPTGQAEQAKPAPATAPAKGAVHVKAAPKPVGAYPHARREGDLLFVSGIGPRNPADNSIPGGPIRTPDGKINDYDIRAQTHAVIANIRTILESCGARLEDCIDVTCFLVNMDRDFAGFNEVYGQYFKDIQATRTTLAVSALPTPIAVELKVIARSPEARPQISATHP
jgi:2-aminophenol/2-amino-5-chlorophenol 1,6-dioxygenase subunit alpha